MDETRTPARKKRVSAAKTAAKPATAPRKTAARGGSPARKAAAGATAPANREEMVRTAAYFRAQQRGFTPGREWEDWLAAEAEVQALTVAAAPATRKRKTTPRKARDE